MFEVMQRTTTCIWARKVFSKIARLEDNEPLGIISVRCAVLWTRATDDWAPPFQGGRTQPTLLVPISFRPIPTPLFLSFRTFSDPISTGSGQVELGSAVEWGVWWSQICSSFQALRCRQQTPVCRLHCADVSSLYAVRHGPAFAMTMNEAQGPTLQRVSVLLAVSYTHLTLPTIFRV